MLCANQRTQMTILALRNVGLTLVRAVARVGVHSGTALYRFPTRYNSPPGAYRGGA